MSFEWQYQWAVVNVRLQVYIRYRFEKTLDGIHKPVTEILAYLVEAGSKEGWGWNAFQNDGSVFEKIGKTAFPFYTVQFKIENIVREDIEQKKSCE